MPVHEVTPDREDAPDARELAEDQADWVAAYDRQIAANVRAALPFVGDPAPENVRRAAEAADLAALFHEYATEVDEVIDAITDTETEASLAQIMNVRRYRCDCSRCTGTPAEQEDD